MKNLYLVAVAFCITTSSLVRAQTFDMTIVDALETQMTESLETDSLAIEWANASDDLVKSTKFNQLLVQIGSPPIARQWAYPNSATWPLIDWSKVDQLKELWDDQFEVMNMVGIVAQSDEEAAKLSTVGWLIRNSGKDVKPWFERWFLDLAQSQSANLKRLAICSISNFGEDILRDVGDTGQARQIDWNSWEQAFNLSDDLGKALLMMGMTELACRTEQYEKVAELHVSVLDGTNDDLKAIALFSGVKRLGQTVTTRWQAIAENSSNVKLKALALEALSREN